jgi:hypothetical protein
MILAGGLRVSEAEKNAPQRQTPLIVNVPISLFMIVHPKFPFTLLGTVLQRRIGSSDVRHTANLCERATRSYCTHQTLPLSLEPREQQLPSARQAVRGSSFLFQEAVLLL